uniref:ShKT domain-containing protein n=1 Tax=Caenorhabditis tropicalis TaxID=1561998 RepID=A0A1I7TVV4_9PELO
MLFLLSLLIPLATTRITPYDLSCSIHNGTHNVYSSTAASCQNVLSDEYCNIAYIPADPYSPVVAEGNDADRPLLCYTLGTATPSPLNQDARSAAIANCPKTCGYCCLTNAYKCQNLLYPRVNCKNVSKAMCLSPLWRQILAEDCPATCGFCDLNGCIDLVVGCENDPSICHTVGLEDFVNQNCRMTCNRCSVGTQQPCRGRR